MTTESFNRRRLLSFSLRSFLAFVVLIGLGLSWLGLRLHKAKQQRESVIAVEKLGGRVVYEYQEENWDSSPGPEWLRNLLGRHFFDKDVRVEFTNNGNGPTDHVDDISCLSGMEHLRLLYLDGTLVSDISPVADKKELWFLSIGRTNVEDLSPLANLPNLSTLNASRTSVSDLSALRGHKLERIWLRGTNVNDISVLAGMESLVLVDLYKTQVADVSPLSTATDLESLSLNWTKVSDLTPLMDMKNLQSLDVGRTNVSADSARRLQDAIPDCEIEGP